MKCYIPAVIIAFLGVFFQYSSGILEPVSSTDSQERSASSASYDKKFHQCPSRSSGYFKFLPIHLVTLNEKKRTHSFASPCFSQNDLELIFVDNNTVEIIHQTRNRSGFCGEAFYYSFFEDYSINTYFFERAHRVRFTNLSPREMWMIKEIGILVFGFCDSPLNLIYDIYKTLTMVLGGLGTNPYIPIFGSKPMSYQVKNSIQFIKEATGYEWKQRPVDEVVELDESLIKSGDYFAVMRFDAVDAMIQWGTGSHAGHNCMALWVGDQLYIVESQNAPYWPKAGIQMTPYKQWIKWARNADYMVTWIPLKKEYSERFNATAAYEFFKTLEGMPYGFPSFAFTWIDTKDANYPSIVDPQFFAPFFAAMDKVSPLISEQICSLGLNMRLGTENLNVSQIVEEVYKRNMTLEELYAIPEQEGWMYPDGPSYVCSSLVVALWKAGGLFGDTVINSVEFTGTDLYRLTFLDPNPEVPENCKALDPENRFCQIMGAWRMEFPDLSTVEPYDYMNEHCPSQPPEYKRTPGC